MDRKKRRNSANDNTDENTVINHVETKGIIFIAIAVFMFCALLGFNVGSVGGFTAKVLTYALGRVAFILPLYLLVIGLGCAIKHEMLSFSKKFFSILLLIVSLIGLLHYFMVPDGQELTPDILPTGGGLLGGVIVLTLKRLLGNAGALIVLFAGVLAGAVLTTKFSISESVKKAGEGVKVAAHSANEKFEVVKEKYQERKRIYDQEHDDSEKPLAPMYTGLTVEDPNDIAQPVFNFPEPIDPPNVTTVDTEAQEEESPEDTTFKETKTIANKAPKSPSAYKFPPLNLLNPLQKVKKAGGNDAIREQSRIIEQTLIDFNVRATMVNVTKGPSVTRFELAPAPGVKVNKIQNLGEDLALKLAVPGIRIEPIPGKAAIGVEVPSIAAEPVNFRAVVDCDAVRNASGKLCVGLGKDISGNVIVADLSKMPHLLVAGSTGSGKSVCINTIIASLLFRAAPDEVKLILVDPKVVELTNYNGIPHLLTPVVTNAKKAASALHWAVIEMERRYTLFAEAQVREINKYNEVSEDKLPFIVIIIDELADLMMVAAVDVEDAILRLAQKARACGIHLILATQRPSVDVLTGIVKANIPSRIAFAVSSQIDSRTILDEAGAEKLLGKGDMLFKWIGSNKPQRIQGAFISDDELEKVINYIKAQNIETEFSEEVTTQALKGDKKAETAAGGQEGNNSDQDELFEDAVRLVMATQQASSSMLQRKFRIGYTRAARLVDTMEELGIVGPQDGAKPRQLIMSNATIEEKFFTNKNNDGGELK